VNQLEPLQAFNIPVLEKREAEGGYHPPCRRV
jgi:hypothetical protein